jgi:hypothetical protein
MGSNTNLLARVAVVVIGAAFLLYAVAIAMYLWDYRVQHASVTRISTEPVDEREAVETTRLALQMTGGRPEALRPVPYWSTSPAMFARNADSPNEGYVLWAGDSDREWDFIVHCKWAISVAQCSVSRGH